MVGLNISECMHTKHLFRHKPSYKNMIYFLVNGNLSYAIGIIALDQNVVLGLHAFNRYSLNNHYNFICFFPVFRLTSMYTGKLYDV